MSMYLLAPAYQDKITSGSVAAIEAAGIMIGRAQDGWEVSDPAAAESILDAYDPLPPAKSAKLFEIESQFAAKFAAGAVYNGTLVQIDAESRANIAAKGTKALGVLNGTPGALPWPDGFYWIAADNSHVPMDAAACYAFSQAIDGYVTALIFARRAMKDAVSAAQTQADVSAIDVPGTFNAISVG